MLLSPLPQLLEPVHNLSEIPFIYSHILATVSLFSRPGQNCYISLCYLSFQRVKKDPEQALRLLPCRAKSVQRRQRLAGWPHPRLPAVVCRFTSPAAARPRAARAGGIGGPGRGHASTPVCPANLNQRLHLSENP